MTQLLIRIFVKNNKRVEDPSVRQVYGALGGMVGIVCNLLLCVFKFFAGIMTGAISITADAMNNLSDAASSIITLIGFYLAGKPADEEHPYGHGRMEYIAGFVVSLVILLMGIQLLESSVDKILHPAKVSFRILSVVILLVSILVKFWMAAFDRKVGGIIQSETLKAAATDSLSDCIATGAVLFGLLFFYYTGYNVDGWIGILVAGFVLWAGFGAARDTMHPLLGQAADSVLVSQVTDTVMSFDLVVGVHDMAVHDYGLGRRILSLHAEVPANVNIMEAHDVIDNIEMKLMHDFSCEATIHMDPVETDDQATTQAKDFVSQVIGGLDQELSIHDFRIVRGKTHTNLIFDMVVPTGRSSEKEYLAKEVKEIIHRKNSHYYAVVTPETSYIGK